jgi:hypothetical protein
MSKYELWLDESGDFEKDLIGEEVPSIVGGLLVASGSLTQVDAKKLLNEVREGSPLVSQWVHATDIKGKAYGEFATKVLTCLKENNITLVIFENEEKLKIVNSDLTYLHLLSEGIIQLFQTLAMDDEVVELSILAARRTVTSEDREPRITEMIKKDQYTQRLKEKLDLGYARRSINPKKWSWSFHLDSARTDHRLMLADIVCHSWFRRDSKKFTEDQRRNLLLFYNPSFHFTAIERATLTSIQRQLDEGAIGESLYEWLLVEKELFISQSYHEEVAASLAVDSQKSFLYKILKRLGQLPDFARNTQLSVVSNHLQTLIQLERNFGKAKEALLKVQDTVIPIMKEMGMNHYTFFFDVHLMLFTNATHQGDIELSENQMMQNRQYLGYLLKRWESLDLVLDYFVREAVHLTNTYYYTGVIEKLDKLEKFINDTIALFPLAFQDELLIDTEEMKADILGKVYGTRLQARCFLSRKDPQQIQLARSDSDEAMKQFIESSDLSRQYQYRSQIECEAGKFQNALEWLGKSVGLQNEESKPSKVMEKILEADQTPKEFGLMHFTRLMAEAALQDQLSFAEDLYHAWTNAKVDDKVLTQYSKQHPYEIIFWKLGTYLMMTGSTNGAIKKYNEAIDICLENSKSFTLQSISLAIIAEEIFFLSKAGKKYSTDTKNTIKLLREQYKKFSENNLPTPMRDHFHPWEELFTGSKNVNDNLVDELFSLSRDIAY